MRLKTSTAEIDPEAQRLAFQRAVERGLLILSAAFMLVNLAALSLVRPDDRPTYVATMIIWSLCAAVGYLLLERYLPARDYLLFPLVMFLCGWGLILIDRLAPQFGQRQTVWLVVSTAALLATTLLSQPLHWLRSYRYLWLIGGLVLLVSTIALGRNPSEVQGAPRLWLGVGDVNFQPSEALKVILVAFLGSYLAEQYPALRAETLTWDRRLRSLSPRVIGPILLMWGVSVVILIWQRDLGTAVLFFMVFLILLYVATGSQWIVVSGLGLVLIAAAVGYQSFAVVRVRIDIWFNPWPEASGDAYQLVQSLQAFAAGGVFGQGIGQGSPDLVPVTHSDFIFAAVGEEWGLLGVLVVIACILTLVVRGLKIAGQQTGRPFRALLAVGLTALIGLQSALIMGGVLRVLPLTGVTLPYMSYGGSSLLMSFVILGLLLRLSSPEN